MYPQSKIKDNLTSRFKLKKKNHDGSMFLPQEVKQFTEFSERTTPVKLKTFHSGYKSKHTKDVPPNGQ